MRKRARSKADKVRRASAMNSLYSRRGAQYAQPKIMCARVFSFFRSILLLDACASAVSVYTETHHHHNMWRQSQRLLLLHCDRKSTLNTINSMKRPVSLVSELVKRHRRRLITIITRHVHVVNYEQRFGRET